ncbi:hypothetical protein PAXINDRAFT_9098 [Paxillus involutus ATCC 200175]|nr:hypothetical protein PAXINDRAFT_9098 [Paxillus involutus ATCC 200175]
MLTSRNTLHTCSLRARVSYVGERLPKLGAFIPPGSNFDTVSSAPGLGGGPRFGKVLAGRKPKKGCHAKEEGTFVAISTELSKCHVVLGILTSSTLINTHQHPSLLHSPSCFSPGWHTLPVSADPSIEESDRAAMGDSFWHTTNMTWGNNIFAHENWGGRNTWMYNRRPEGSVEAPTDITLTPSVTYSYPYAPNPADTKEDSMAEAQSHIDATVTQLFYTSNMTHNIGSLVAHNANFVTPPDRQNGRHWMYLWNTPSPYPDTDMEAGIVIHELAHGLSTCITGGPKHSGCLGWGASGSMGKGWGDFIATLVRSTSTYSDYAMGAWASNREGGIRNYVYSLNTTVN